MTLRRGFALLVVLATLASIAIVAMAGTATLGARVAESANRAAELRVQWRIEGCAAALTQQLDRISDVAAAPVGSATARWVGLDSLVEQTVARGDAGFDGCVVELEPVGLRVALNSASQMQLLRYLTACGVDPELADTIAASALDWIDRDSFPRSAGAEREWYRAAGRRVPRDGPMVDAAELALVRGFDRLPLALQGDILAHVAIADGRLLAGRADPRVLASLPGIGANAALAIHSVAIPSTGAFDLGAATAKLRRDEHDSVATHISELMQQLTGAPDAWVVTISATDGWPRLTEELTLWLARTGAGISVSLVRRKLL